VGTADKGMFAAIFDALIEQHGPQERWWPADDAFEIMVGALLVQRTAWRNAERAIGSLKREGLLVPARLLQIEPPVLEERIRPAGFFRVKARRLQALASFVVGSGGLASLRACSTAQLRERLLGVEGIGPETADAILGFAFERPVFVVDAYARRLFGRLRAPARALADADLKSGCEGALRTAPRLNSLHALIVAHSQQCCGAIPDCDRCCLSPRCGYACSVVKRSA